MLFPEFAKSSHVACQKLVCSSIFHKFVKSKSMHAVPSSSIDICLSSSQELRSACLSSSFCANVLMGDTNLEKNEIPDNIERNIMHRSTNLRQNC